MNETSGNGKGSSCLVLAEKKKNQRHGGGCIGIFFQFFDWNKRLTKKRFFFKKLLLPPARAKQGSTKKFKGDEKMPNSKLHLIANENNGGFPSAKNGGTRAAQAEEKHEMQVPGLVARLMGLESIPSSQQDTSWEFSGSCGDDREKQCLGSHSSEADNQEVDLKMAVANVKKHDLSRPQKLQKTGTHERRVVVTRFGPEALQIKSVLSRARKYNNHHPPKLVSPLKSPRTASGKSASRSSRLIGAATKILEPGLQATSRAKCSLTSSTSVNNGIVTERAGTMPSDIENLSGYDAGTAKSLMGHTCCQNCGNLLDAVDCGPEVEGQQAVPIRIVSSDLFNSSSLGSSPKGRSFIPSHENDVVLLRSKEKFITLYNEDKNNAQSCNESSTGRTPLLVNMDSSCQPCGALEDDDEVSSFAFKHKTQTKDRVLSGERISSGSRASNVKVKRVSSGASAVSGTKDFVALNRSLSSRTRSRSPTKVDSSKFDLERKPSNRQDDSLTRASFLERKRRTPNVSQVGDTTSINLVTLKERNISSDAQGGKRRGFDASSPNSSNVKSKQGGQKNTYKVNENKVNEVVSFIFNSPFKKKIVISGEKEDTSNANGIKTCSQLQSPPPLSADALGAFLEQKLKDLISQENVEFYTDGPSKKSTAVILQELISLHNSEHLTCSDDHIFNDKYKGNHRISLGTSWNDNHLSPGSVLEASFSSSSLDESSGHGFHPDSMTCSYDQLEQMEHEAELLDFATSFNKGKTGYEILTEIVNQIPRILQSLNSFRKELTRSNLTHMKNVILNAELVLGNATEHSENEVPQLLISCFLLNELETMASNAVWTDFNGFVGCAESEERNHLKGYLLDCVIEYLESNCCQYYNSVFKARSGWIKPLSMKAKMLAQEVKSEIKKWECLAGMLPDEIIEWDMSNSLGKWTDFNIEAFEASVDIDDDVLQILVDEIVEDLVDFRLGAI